MLQLLDILQGPRKASPTRTKRRRSMRCTCRRTLEKPTGRA